MSTFAPTVTPSSFTFSSDYPTPSPTPSYNYYITYLPASLPYPVSYPISTLPPNYNYGTPQNPNQIPILRFVIYLCCTIMILALILFVNRRNPPPTSATTTTAANTANNDTSQDQVDLVKSMTPQERKEYVTNFLKTQKFVDDQENTNASAPSSSFRVTKSSSRQIDTDADIESSTSGIDDIDQYHNDTLSPKAYPSCAICLERFQNGEDICSAQNKDCPHEFHLECLFPWLLKSQDCPCCRRDYLSIEPIQMEHTVEA